VGEAFFYTIQTLKDYQKIAVLTLILYIITLTLFIPNLGLTTLPLGLILLFSATSFFVKLAQKTKTIESYIYNLKQQNMLATLLACIPTSVALTGGIIIVSGIILVGYLYLRHTPITHNFYQKLTYLATSGPEAFIFLMVAILLYFWIITYNFLGKLGKIIFTDSFGQKLYLFFSIFFDLRFFVRALHLDYLFIYIKWLGSVLALLYFQIDLLSQIINREFSPLVSLLLLVVVDFLFLFTAIFTFFSGWKGWEIMEQIEEEEELKKYDF
jgi:hypothetical protein